MSFWDAFKKDWASQKTTFELRLRICDPTRRGAQFSGSEARTHRQRRGDRMPLTYDSRAMKKVFTC
jgi:hypothetical protein